MCPATITNLLTTSSAVEPRRMFASGSGSSCGAPKIFPGYTYKQPLGILKT
jgi:hypothetical protein